MGLAYDAAGSLQVFKQSRLLGTAVASGGLPWAGELVCPTYVLSVDLLKYPPPALESSQFLPTCLCNRLWKWHLEFSFSYDSREVQNLATRCWPVKIFYWLGRQTCCLLPMQVTI
eukprot:COSAG01_NODE_2233_length_8112_cov_41.569699_5_plen_115_part_00